MEVDRALYEGAQRAAQRAAALSRSLGLDAEGLVGEEAPEVPVAETLLTVARERDAQAIVIGAHAHAGLLGSIARGVVREAWCPVLVVREPVRAPQAAVATASSADRS